MKRVLFKLSFIFCATLNAQITLINTSTTNDLVRGSISIIGKNITISSGQGFFVKSYDECKTLIPMNKPTPVGFEDNLCRIDTSLMFLRVGDFSSNTSYIYKSVDGGYNWLLKFDTTGAGIPYLLDMKFFDSLNGIAPTTFYRQVRTSDGGNTWIWSNGPLHATTMTEIFEDSTIVVAGSASFPIIYMSKDRGNSWPISEGLNWAMPFDIAFLNKDTIFGITDISTQYYCSYFLRSFNGGKNWEKISRSSASKPGYPPEIAFRTLCIKKTNEIYVTATDQTNMALILKSTDLGQNWSTFNTGIKAYLNDMKFINDSVALVAGHNGVLFKWNTKTAVFVGIDKIRDEGLKLNIFPNPTNEKLYVEFSTDLIVKKLTLQNYVGQVLYETKNPQNPIEINLSTFPKGIYFLIAENSIARRGFKVMKE